MSELQNLPNFTWPQVAVIAIVVVGLLGYFGLCFGNIKIHIGRKDK